MRAAQGSRPGGASAQRISDWKAGRNVPARFESLLPVVLTLTDLARKIGAPLSRELAEPKEWQRLWREATTWNPDDETEVACPYPGLTAYRRDNRDLFFGRARATADLTDLVRTATGITVVIGASGAGKSSLLAAGLIPALGDWQTTLCTPGSTPSTALLAPRADSPHRLLVIDQAEELFTTGEADREAVLTLLDACATRADDPIAVVLALRADFYAHSLAHPILQDALEHRSFLLGPMRTDELAQAISGPARAAGLELESGLEELVITELCGVGDRRDRRTYDPGALPLLSHVMAATWQHREGRRLTIDGYRKAGGVVGSVADTAEYAWNELTSGQQSAARSVLLGLVTVTQDGHDTRRSASRADLLRRCASSEDATAALELLSRTRLITLDADAVTLTHEIVLTAWPRLRAWIDEDRVGSLVRQRLEADAAEWAAQDHDPTLLYRDTRLDNALGHVDPPTVGPLATDYLTAAARARTKARRRSTWIRARFALLGVALLIFAFGAYNQSRLAGQQRDDKNFAAVLAEADRVRQTDPSLAAQLDLIAWRMRPGDTEVRSRLLRTENTPLATVTPAHPQAVSKIAYRPDGRVLASVSGTTLKLWDTTDPQHPKPLSTSPLPLLGLVGPSQTPATTTELDNVENAFFGPDGNLLATVSASDNHTRHLVLWDVSKPESPRQIVQLPETADSSFAQIAFDPGGRTLAVLTDARLTLWNIADPAHPVLDSARQLPAGTTGHLQLRFATGALLAVRYDQTVVAPAPSQKGTNHLELWGVSDPANPVLLTVPGNPIEVTGLFTFSLDGSLLAVVAKDSSIGAESIEPGVIDLWDVTEPARAHRISSITLDKGSVSALSFGPDTLAVGSDMETALWNVINPAKPVRIDLPMPTGTDICRYTATSTPCHAVSRSLAFTPDGHTLASGDPTGNIRTWSLPPTVLIAHSGFNGVPAFDSTGANLVSTSSDGRVELWDLRNPRLPRRMGEYRVAGSNPTAVFTADGKTMLLFTFHDGPNWQRRTDALDLSDPNHIRILGTPELPGGGAELPALSPDRHLAATISSDQKVQLWDMTDPLRPQSAGPPIAVGTGLTGIAFGPDSRTLLLQDHENRGDTAEFVITLWNIQNPQRPQQISELLRRPTTSVGSIILSTDRRTMFISSNEQIQAWDIDNSGASTPLSKPVPGHAIAINSMDLTGDSRTLVTASNDGSVQLWDVTDRVHPQRTETLAGPGNAVSLAYFTPDGRHVLTHSQEGPIRLWDLDIQHAADHICEVTGKLWTEDLWHRHLPQLPYRPPC